MKFPVENNLTTRCRCIFNNNIKRIQHEDFLCKKSCASESAAVSRRPWLVFVSGETSSRAAVGEISWQWGWRIGVTTQRRDGGPHTACGWTRRRRRWTLRRRRRLRVTRAAAAATGDEAEAASRGHGGGNVVLGRRVVAWFSPSKDRERKWIWKQRKEMATWVGPVAIGGSRGRDRSFLSIRRRISSIFCVKNTII
jgi:hypothetical protein